MKKFSSLLFIISILTFSLGGDTDNLAVADSGTTDCCELAGDGNDDGIVDIDDYLFIVSWGYGFTFPPGDVNYPGPSSDPAAYPFCCDQFTPDGTCAAGQNSISGYTQVSNHLVGTVDPVCGTSGN